MLRENGHSRAVSAVLGPHMVPCVVLCHVFLCVCVGFCDTFIFCT